MKTEAVLLGKGVQRASIDPYNTSGSKKHFLTPSASPVSHPSASPRIPIGSCAFESKSDSLEKTLEQSIQSKEFSQIKMKAEKLKKSKEFSQIKMKVKKLKKENENLKSENHKLKEIMLEMTERGIQGIDMIEAVTRKAKRSAMRLERSAMRLEDKLSEANRPSPYKPEEYDMTQDADVQTEYPQSFPPSRKESMEPEAETDRQAQSNKKLEELLDKAQKKAVEASLTQAITKTQRDKAIAAQKQAEEKLGISENALAEARTKAASAIANAAVAAKNAQAEIVREKARADSAEAAQKIAERNADILKKTKVREINRENNNNARAMQAEANELKEKARADNAEKQLAEAEKREANLGGTIMELIKEANENTSKITQLEEKIIQLEKELADLKASKADPKIQIRTKIVYKKPQTQSVETQSIQTDPIQEIEKEPKPFFEAKKTSATESSGIESQSTQTDLQVDLQEPKEKPIPTKSLDKPSFFELIAKRIKQIPIVSFIISHTIELISEIYSKILWNLGI